MKHIQHRLVQTWSNDIKIV